MGVDADGIERRELMAADIDEEGVATPRSVHGPLGPNEIVGWSNSGVTSDGRRVVYEVGELGAGRSSPWTATFEADGTIVTTPLDGSATVPVGHLGDLTLSPDESSLAFVALGPPAGVYLVAFDDPEPWLVAPVAAGAGVLSDLAFTPDATRLLYVALDDAGTPQLFMASTDPAATGAAIRVSDLTNPMSELHLGQPAFCADGERVTFRGDRDALDVRQWFIADLSADPPMSIEVVGPQDGLAPVIASFDPVCRRAAYWLSPDPAGLGDFWAVELDGTTPGERAVINAIGPGEADVRTGEWTPDGGGFVYAARHVDPERLDGYWVDMSGATPKTPVALTEVVEDLWEIFHVEFGANGKTYLLIDTLTGGALEEVDGAGSPTSTRRRIVEGRGSPHYVGLSGDERFLFYTHGSATESKLYRLDLAASGIPERVEIAAPGPSETLYYAKLDSSRSMLVYVTRVYEDATAPQRLFAVVPGRDAPATPVVLADEVVQAQFEAFALR